MDMNEPWTDRPGKLRVVRYWWKEQDGKCCICGGQMLAYKRQHTENPDRASIEHLIPKRENGPNTAANTRLAHARCNNALGGLWSINRHRAQHGLPPLSQEWALSTGARVNGTAQKRKRQVAAAAAAAVRPPYPLNAPQPFPERAKGHPRATLAGMVERGEPVNLPRGATLPR